MRKAAQKAPTQPKTDRGHTLREVAQMLKAIREERRLSQEDVAAKAGLTRNTVQRYEAGKGLKVQELFAIFEALGIEPDPLFVNLRNALAHGAPGALDEIAKQVEGAESKLWKLLRSLDGARRDELVDFLLKTSAMYFVDHEWFTPK